MRSWPNTSSVSSSVETVAAAAEEKVIATLPALSTQAEGQKIIFDGSVQLALGVGTTSIIARIRRGGLTGAAILTTPPISTTASTTADFALNGEDTPGEVVGQPYVLTVQPTGGNATNKLASLNASY